MALDPSIFNALGRGVKSIGEYDQEAQASQLNALALQQGRMKQDEYTRSLADQNSLREATRGFGDDATANYNALLRTGNLQAAQGYRKQLDDQALTQAKTKQEGVQTAGFQQDQAIKSTQLHLQALSMVGDPQQFAQWAQAGVQSGVFTPEQYQRGMQALQGVTNPQQFAELKQKALMGGASALEQLKLKADAEQQAERVRQFGVTSTETARSHRAGEGLTARGQDITMRGQNLTDARSRESTAATMTKPFEVTGPDGVPMLVQQDRKGNIAPVAGFQPKGMGATKLTEDQGKATGWLVQAENAYGNMRSAIQRDPGAAKPGVGDAVGAVPGLGAVGNMLTGADRQQFNQATSSLSEALLRAATGAGVNRDEALQKVRELTPVFGDTEQTRVQKMDAIPLYIESLKVRAGPGSKQVQGIIDRGTAGQRGAAPAKSAHPADIADLLTKYGAK